MCVGFFVHCAVEDNALTGALSSFRHSFQSHGGFCRRGSAVTIARACDRRLTWSDPVTLTAAATGRAQRRGVLVVGNGAM